MDSLNNLMEKYFKLISDELNIEPRIVFGDGNTNADLVLIGEAPGKNEEETGKAFVGAAGKNLNEFLEILDIKREDIYITNVVKIRPTKINAATGQVANRTPNKKEIDLSMDTLEKQLSIINPKIVVTLGNIPLRAMLKDDNAKIGEYHGKIIKLSKYDIFPLYHPASIIYNRGLYDTYIDDVKGLRKYLDSMGVR